MAKPAEFRLARWRRKIKERGIRKIVEGRLEGLRWKIRLHPAWHRLLSRWFALRGNQVPFRNLNISVTNPMISASDKAMIFHRIYERAEIELAEEHIDRSLPTVEFGGSIGVVACFVNHLLDRPGEHVVVEANPRLIPSLEENRSINKSSFEIIPAAVAYNGPSIDFTIQDFLSGSVCVGEGEAVSVPTTSLKRIIDDHGFDRVNLVCDIEGAEIDLVEHELETMKQHVSRIVIETHDRLLKRGVTAAMIDRLEAGGFVLAGGLNRDDEVLVFVNREPATSAVLAATA